MNLRKGLRMLLAMLCLVTAMQVTAYAEGRVTYDGNANQFLFEPGTVHSPTNLFENFQGVMPGDTLEEQILIKNETHHGVKVVVYMRSLGGQENTDDFLSQMKLTVRQNGDSMLFEAPANETAQLTDWVCLGTVYSGGEIKLDLVLEVPITMGNAYQNDIGYIDWQFKVEELPIESTDPLPPRTGDTYEVLLYSALALASLAALLVLLVTAKRKKQKQDEK